MSVWARNEKNRLVRTISPRNPVESIVSQVSQDNLLPQMDNPDNQQGLYEPPQHGGNATLPINPVLGGGNGNFQQNQYRVPPAPLPNVERTLREILQPQRTTTNSCIRLPDEANQFLMMGHGVGPYMGLNEIGSPSPIMTFITINYLFNFIYEFIRWYFGFIY